MFVLPPSLTLSKTVGFIPLRLTRLGPSKFSEIKSNLALIRLGRDLFDSNSNSNSKFKEKRSHRHSLKPLLEKACLLGLGASADI